MRTSRFLVTGGAGFVGTMMINQLFAAAAVTFVSSTILTVVSGPTSHINADE
jgi:nucleoside-diphosphate-sugar epimerase